MKRILRLITILPFALGVLTGCAPIKTTPIPTNTSVPTIAVLPTSTPAPTEAPLYGPWKLVRTSEGFTQRVYFAGFLNDTFGLTVGYAGAVYSTHDGGQTWAQTKNESFCRFGLEIVDEKVAWTCGNAGHMRLSTDGGQTWQAVANYGPSEPNQCRFLSFLDATTGWAATPSQIGATSDGGQTWTEILLPKGIQDIVGMAMRTATAGYLLDKTGALFVTSDGGQTWSSQTLGLKANEALTINSAPATAMRFIDAEHGEIVYMLETGDTWFAQTADGGKTWQRVSLPGIQGMFNTLYLSRDGKTLTAFFTAEHKILVFVLP